MRGRVVILIILILVVGAVAVGALFLAGGDEGTTADTTGTPGAPGTVSVPSDNVQSQPTQAGEPTGDECTDKGGAYVVIALQDLPRGFRLTEQFISGDAPAVGVVCWPANVIPVPQNSFEKVEDVRNQLARTDIPIESPVLSTQLVADLIALGDVGSDAALLLPAGRVAISMPLDASGIGSMAHGLKHGDYVDVILSFLFIEVDETFQTRQPNQISIISRDEAGLLVFSEPLEGRPEPSTLSSLGVLVSPSEQQRPRLVTQRTVTGAQVIHVGFFPPDGKIVGVMSPEPPETPTPAPVQEGQQQATAAPTVEPTPNLPIIITLAVEPQDALVLTWALDAQIPVTYALRSNADKTIEPPPTTAVTLQYLIENYDIPPAPILPYALEPAIRGLRSVGITDLEDLLGLGAANQGGSTEGQ
jgi:Flp pilus assembly protein CpaB